MRLLWAHCQQENRNTSERRETNLAPVFRKTACLQLCTPEIAQHTCADHMKLAHSATDLSLAIQLHHSYGLLGFECFNFLVKEPKSQLCPSFPFPLLRTHCILLCWAFWHAEVPTSSLSGGRHLQFQHAKYLHGTVETFHLPGCASDAHKSKDWWDSTTTIVPE